MSKLCVCLRFVCSEFGGSVDGCLIIGLNIFGGSVEWYGLSSVSFFVFGMLDVVNGFVF